jgi:hypothetical protein
MKCAGLCDVYEGENRYQISKEMPLLYFGLSCTYSGNSRLDSGNVTHFTFSELSQYFSGGKVAHLI